MKRIGWGWVLVGALLMLPFSAFGQTLEETGGGVDAEIVLAILGIVGAAVLGVLRLVHKKTKNTLDDRAYELLSKWMDDDDPSVPKAPS